MSDLLKGIVFGFIAQVLTFLQLQGQFQYKWIKDNAILVSIVTAPVVSLLFLYSVRGFVAWADGQIWPSRLIGFAIGIIVFTLGSTFLFGEHLSLKTIICLILAIGILTVQLIMK